MILRAARTVAVITIAGTLAAGCTRVVDTGPSTDSTPEGGLAPSGSVAPPLTPPAGVDAGRSDPVVDPVYPGFGNANLDVLHYGLELAWSPAARVLSGTATLTIRIVRPVSELVLDFSGGYTIGLITLDGARVSSQRQGDDLIVKAPTRLGPDQRVTVVVNYRGKPVTTPMPSGRSDFPEGLGLRARSDGSAWTMQEPYGAFTWYPVNDHPSDEALYDIAVTVPTGWSAVASGRLLASGAAGGGLRFHWRSSVPVASYLTTLAVNRYRMVTAEGPRGIPVTYWLRRGTDDHLEPTLQTTVESLAWLEEKFGPYPFDSAGVVVVDSLSAMETQQMITLGARIGDRSGVSAADYIEEIILHELAHQWFGNAVTPKDWRGVWLNEGFAMYTQALWSIEDGRTTEAKWVTRARLIDSQSRATAGPPGHWDANHFGESNIYFGPALMLHEIRQQIGDREFLALARDWVQTQRHQPVDRAGFTAFVNTHTGRDLTGVIDKWLDSPTTPS